MDVLLRGMRHAPLVRKAATRFAVIGLLLAAAAAPFMAVRQRVDNDLTCHDYSLQLAIVRPAALPFPS